MENRSLWRVAWLFRMVMAFVVLAGLGIIAALNGRSGTMVAHAALAFVLVMPLIGSAVTVTGHPQFWLLYLCSPPMLVTVLLCGLGALTPIGWVLGWGVGVPWFVSGLLVDAGTLWVHNRTADARREQLRRRAGGPASELPALPLWERVRSLRLAVAVGCGLLAAVILLLQRDQLALAGCLALLVGAAGCLRLDATGLGWLRNSPLVAYDEQRREWRATYVGRLALFVPLEWVRQVMAPDRPALRRTQAMHRAVGSSSSKPCRDDSAADGSAALLALLGQGSLGPVVRRAVAGLTPEPAHRLVLHLSLQAGGATAIRYLRPALPQPLRPAAECYATFADEAAKPLDLQHWMTVLTTITAVNAGAGPFDRLRAALRPRPQAPTDGFNVIQSPEITQTLIHARDALLNYDNTPGFDATIRDLRHLIQVLHCNNLDEMLLLSWPAALLMHVESHRARLLAD